MSLNFFQTNELDALVDEYEGNGYVIINAYFSQAKNIYDVFDEIKKSLPLDPPLYSRCNFDAFSDSIFGGLDLLESDKACVFLVDLNKALRNDSKSYHILLDVLSDNFSYFESEGKSVVFFIS
ncbi:barstar family protein [Brenneria izbisi]|uniref:Barstar family protein n=1 Tax=Brenneria izbisi TaxID=2939450 RepID=A0AA42C4L8_9GAMM|nr:barstar family protein [Brenneria izbisi]MCV9878106.1 barstar family protein [Brenneria izbisi]MCV9881330.1 barstar family protein [Brenneria izbisi]